jgi:exosome complex component RRP4
LSEGLKPIIYVQQKDIVLPGDLIAEGNVEYNTIYIYSVNGKHYSSILGIVEVKDNKIMLTPIEQAYIPRPNDIVIGIVEDIGNTYWMVDLNSPYEGQLPISETPLKQPYPIGDLMRKYLDIGDYVIVKILVFDRNRDPLISMKGSGLGKITTGKVIDYRVSRIRFLKRRGKPLLEAIARETKTNIMVANNGRIWVSGESGELEDIAILALKKIERTSFSPPSAEALVEFIREEKERRGV